MNASHCALAEQVGPKGCNIIYLGGVGVGGMEIWVRQRLFLTPKLGEINFSPPKFVCIQLNWVGQVCLFFYSSGGWSCFFFKTLPYPPPPFAGYQMVHPYNTLEPWPTCMLSSWATCMLSSWATCMLFSLHCIDVQVKYWCTFVYKCM